MAHEFRLLFGVEAEVAVDAEDEVVLSCGSGWTLLSIDTPGCFIKLRFGGWML